jgi:hypothetical protein
MINAVRSTVPAMRLLEHLKYATLRLRMLNEQAACRVGG